MGLKVLKKTQMCSTWHTAHLFKMLPKLTLANIIRSLISTGTDERTGDRETQRTRKKREKEVIH